MIFEANLTRNQEISRDLSKVFEVPSGFGYVSE